VVLPRPCGGGSLLVGVKRTLTFAPRHKTKKKASAPSSASLAAGWVMHEYRLAAPLHKNVSNSFSCTHQLVDHMHIYAIHMFLPHVLQFKLLASS
jgi:hypothetical protein